MKRVAVTGLGIICSLGRGADEVWRAIESGRPAFRPPSLFDPAGASRAPVGEVRLREEAIERQRRSIPHASGREAERSNEAELPGEIRLPRGTAPRVTVRNVDSRGAAQLSHGPDPGARGGSRLERMVAWAAGEALDQSGLTPGPATSSFGVALGNSNGGMLEAEEWYAGEIAREGGSSRRGVGALSTSPLPSPAGSGSAAGSKGPDPLPAPAGLAPAAWRDASGALGSVPLSASAALALPASGCTDQLAAWLGARGPRLTVTTACSSSAASIALAAERIRDGEAAAMVAGGGDPLCRLTYAGFAALRLLDPEGCRPFDARRRGLTLGEGAAVLVLEEWERARRRGVRPIAEILGHGASCDAWHMTGCHPEGRGMKSALSEALDRASIAPGRVGYVNAHGTATPANDAAEALAIADILGGAAPVSSTKALHGHLLGGSGAVEATITILALARGLLPATAGTEERDPAAEIDLLLGRPRPARAECAISNSFGFGGGNVVLVFAAPGGGAKGSIS